MADSLTGRSRDFGALWRAWWEEQRGGGKVAARPPDSVPMDVRGGAPRGRRRGAPRGATAVDVAGGQATCCPRPRSAGVVTAVASAGHLRLGDAEPHSRFSNPRAQSLPATDLSSSASFHLYAGSRMTVSGSWPKWGVPSAAGVSPACTACPPKTIVSVLLDRRASVNRMPRVGLPPRPPPRRPPSLGGR